MICRPMAIVDQDEEAEVLEYAHEDFKADKEVVLAAVEQDGRALYHASAELKKDKEIMMEVQNAVSPSPEQIEGFLDPDAKGAIFMVNLLSFREWAEYEDYRDTNLSGKEAYQIYAAGVAKVITRVGGYIGFGADVKRLMLGEVETLWEQVAIAMYPSRAAMLEMIQMPEYAEISVHRTAGLAGQLNIETVAPTGAWLST